MENQAPFLARIEPPRGLYEAVLARLALAARRAARLRLAAFGLVTLISGAALAYALLYAAREFYASGFYDYALLLATDRTLAVTYSRDLVYSLVEAVPSLALLLLAGLSVLLVWSMHRAGRNAAQAFATLPAHG